MTTLAWPADTLAATSGESWADMTLRTVIDAARLSAERLIVVSNREPCIHERQPDGRIVTRRPAGGVVAALDPVVRVVYRGRTTLVRPYPISVEWPSRWADGAATIEACRRGVRSQFGIRQAARLIVSVDRLD